MAHTASPAFAHRPKSNGTAESICLKCYMTIGPPQNEADLEVQEAGHVCAGMNLGALLHSEPPSREPLKP
jgi:hypothetical protein